MSGTHQEQKMHGIGEPTQIILTPSSALVPHFQFFLPAVSASTYCLRRDGTSWRTFNSSSISAGLSAGIGEQNSNSSSLRNITQHKPCALHWAPGSWDQGQWQRVSGPWRIICRQQERTAQLSRASLPHGLVCLDTKFYNYSKAMKNYEKEKIFPTDWT